MGEGTPCYGSGLSLCSGGERTPFEVSSKPYSSNLTVCSLALAWVWVIAEWGARTAVSCPRLPQDPSHLWVSFLQALTGAAQAVGIQKGHETGRGGGMSPRQDLLDWIPV